MQALIGVDWGISGYQRERGGERNIEVKGVKYSVTEGNLLDLSLSWLLALILALL